MITTLDEKDVVARRVHQCGLCGLDIAKGEKHYTQRNADGHSVWTWRAHLACRAKEGAYWEWCGIERRYLSEDDTADPDEFRTFLASDKAGYDG